MHSDRGPRMLARFRPEDVHQQVRRAVDHRELTVEAGCGIDHSEDLDDLRDPVERAEPPSHCREDAERRGAVKELSKS